MNSNHQDIQSLLAYDDIIKCSGYTTLDKILHIKPGEKFSSVVFVDAIKEVVTSRLHKLMAFVAVEDLTGKQEVIFFPRTYKVYEHMLKEREVIYLTCQRDTAEIDINTNECQKVKVIGLSVEHLDEKQ